ncbi:MAG: NAD(P)-dependent oxidoreductase [Acidimicrobiales bacterium]
MTLVGRRQLTAGRPLRVLVGTDRFSEDHSWAEMPDYWPNSLRSGVEIETAVGPAFHSRLVDRDAAPVDVVVPIWAPLPAAVIHGGSFGLVQQFGVGVDNIDLAAAERAGVWVANMPGLNAATVAEHAIALLLCLARRLCEASRGFRPGGWGQPTGRSLAGTTACVIGAGAIGVQIARRLAAFDVVLIGVRRKPLERPDPFHIVFPATETLRAIADADSVIVAAGHQPGQPPLVDSRVIASLKQGALLVNVARGGVIDNDAALEHLENGHLGGVGLDVYPVEPYPSDGPLLNHPRVVATAHTAALTSDYFQAASRYLGDILVRYLRGQPPVHLVTRQHQSTTSGGDRRETASTLAGDA